LCGCVDQGSEEWKAALKADEDVRLQGQGRQDRRHLPWRRKVPRPWCRTLQVRDCPEHSPL
ncbi:hypothetical protein BG015_008436, partial [Linnemannia schmuckeri]